jgi:indolepyruvate ferredoxin oxidoreductase beta subunit
MKKDIILAGVGGQGILSIAACIGMASLKAGLHMKQAEVHGMSQRGGDVQSNLRIADREIASDLIPRGQADLIIGVEPMESLRYLPYLSAGGWVVTNTAPNINIPNYPDIEEILREVRSLPNHIAVDADRKAKELGAARASNMIVLGAASLILGLDTGNLREGIRKIFAKKGEDVVAVNLSAFEAGRDMGERYLKR